MSQSTKTAADKNTMRTRIRQYIVTQIGSGVYPPGTRVVETKLAKELNVSQAPVREAILELSIMGLLEERPYSGAFVRKLTGADIQDIYNTRAFIEEYAATRAAKRITNEQLERFDTVLKLMEAAARSSNIEEYTQADQAFHELIMDAAESKALKHAWEALHLGEWSMMTLAVTKRSIRELTEMHRLIYKHLADHADHSAGAAIFLHIKNFANDLAAYFDERQQLLDE